MTRIGFVRHGITAWNKEKRAQGSSDIPLDQEGLQQARKLAERLSCENWDIIYSSDLLRAKQTAEAVSNAMGNIPLHLDPRIREAGGGQIEGTTEAERIAKWGNNWRELDLDLEKADSILARGIMFLEEVLYKHPNENVLIVSHGSFIGNLLKKLVPHLNTDESLKNTSLTCLVKTDDGWDMELLNCTVHIEEVGQKKEQFIK